MILIKNVSPKNKAHPAVIDIRDCFVVSRSSMFSTMKGVDKLNFYYEQDNCFWDLKTVKGKAIAIYKAIVFICKL